MKGGVVSREEGLRSLIEAVRTEHLTPIEADKLGDELKLSPFEGQDWPANFTDSQWPIAFAALWVSWRDPERLAKEWDRFRFWSGHIWRDPLSEGQVCSLDDAEAAIWSKLVDGALRAKGLPGQASDYADIPAIHWLNLFWMPGFGKMSVRNFAHSDPRYRIVLVDRIDVLKHWPQPVAALQYGPEAQPNIEPTNGDHYRSGAPGHPTSRQIVEAEMKRRAASGETLPSLKNESAALEKWLKHTHPLAPRMSSKTIQNTCSQLYKQSRK